MIIFGSRMYGRKNVVKGWGYCENCGKYGKHSSYNGRKWGHLYFIPLLPEGPRVRVIKECQKCSHGMHIPEIEVPAMLDRIRQSADKAVATLLTGEKEFDDEGTTKPCATYLGSSVELFHCLLAGDYVRQILTTLHEKNVTSAYHLVNGEVLEFSGKSDEAALSYKRAAESDPTDAAPLLSLAFIYLNKKEHEKAQMLYEKALELSSEKFAILQVLLTIYEAVKDYQKLTDTYEHCFNLVPEMARDKKTVKAYKEACKKAGRHREEKIPTPENKASIQVNRNLASEHEQRYIDHIYPPKGKSMLRRWLPLAVVAIILLLIVLIVLPGLKPTGRRSNQRGMEALENGNYDLAITCFTEAIRVNPKNASAYYYRGYAYIEKGEYDKAIADCTKALELDPKNALAYHERGYAYFGKGEFHRAIADCTEAIRLDPKLVEAYIERGAAYSQNSEYNKAIADCTKVLELDPKNAMAYYHRGYVYYEKGDYDKAIADWTEAIRLDPKMVPVYGYRGYAYFNKGDYDRAIADGCSLNIMCIHVSLHSPRTVASGPWSASKLAMQERNWLRGLSTLSRTGTFAVLSEL